MPDAWIPVSERLPELGTDLVLVYRPNCPNSAVLMAQPLQGGGWYSSVLLKPGSVTHWMPLPEPPKE